jgi:hypothetical protein
MSVEIDPGAATMPRSYALPRGPRVCLRPSRSRDLEAVRALATRAGLATEDLALARLVRPDPHRRLVLCATPAAGSAETVLGVGVIELGGSAATIPSLLLVDTHVTGGLHGVLADALIDGARALAGSQVA